MKNLMIIYLLSLPLFGLTQGFDIYNSKKALSISASDFLEIGVKINQKKDCCDFIEYEGHFIESGQDSLTFNFSKSTILQNLNSTTSSYNSVYMNDLPLKKSPKMTSFI